MASPVQTNSSASRAISASGVIDQSPFLIAVSYKRGNEQLVYTGTFLGLTSNDAMSKAIEFVQRYFKPSSIIQTGVAGTQG